MKRPLYFAALCLLFPVLTFAQNKSLGVGTTSPNPNAALHVESPTGNQGAIMPRLSTAQRLAMGSILGMADSGLLLYDNDLKGLYIWNGAAWQSSAKISWPLRDTITVAPNYSTLLDLTYDGVDTVGIASFRNTNPNNIFPLLNMRSEGGHLVFGVTNAPSAPGLEFRAINPTNNQPTLQVTTLGTGIAGIFTNSNGLNSTPALRASTNGPGTAINGLNTSNGNGFAGLFNSTQPTNTFPAIQANTFGTGPGVRVLQSAASLGGGMDVFLQNTTSTAVGLNIDHQGLGTAGRFYTTNPGNTSSSVIVNTNGSGDGVFSQIDNATSTNAALKGRVNNSGGTPGAFEIFNASNPNPSINVLTQGLGSAANFSIDNPLNGFAGLFSITNGTGAAVQGQTASGFAAVYGRREGATNGNAGRFEITDAGNSFPSLEIQTVGTGSAGSFTISNIASSAAAINSNSNGTGPAISANQSNGGLALDILSGGVKFPVTQLSGNDVIPDNAVVVELTGATQLISLPSGGQDGQAIYVVNTGAGSSIVAGTNLDPDRGIMYIRLSGTWRPIVLSMP